MNQLTMGLLVALGLVTFFLYNQNQTLTQNNIKLEAAVEQQEEAMAAMKEQYEKQGKALQNMSRKNAEIEAEKAEYLAILAVKKPGLIENRFNGASEAVMEGLEDDTEALYNLTNPNN